MGSEMCIRDRQFTFEATSKALVVHLATTLIAEPVPDPRSAELEGTSIGLSIVGWFKQSNSTL